MNWIEARIFELNVFSPSEFLSVFIIPKIGGPFFEAMPYDNS